MDGFEFVQLVEAELKQRHISKDEFYKGTGISSATFSQWRKRIYSPSSVAIRKIEDFLGISFSIKQNEKEPAPLAENEPVDYDKWLSSLSQDELLKVIAKATQALQERNK